MIGGVLALLAVSCCAQPPRVEKYFDRESPKSALRGFAYSVEVGDWEYAFESLASESRKAVETPFRLQLAVSFEEDPDTGLSVREEIVRGIEFTESEYAHTPDVVSIDAWIMEYDRRGRVIFDPELGTAMPQKAIGVFLVREGGDGWRVDLVRTIQENFGHIQLSHRAAAAGSGRMSSSAAR